MEINVDPNCQNKNCIGGVISFDGSTGTVCKKCNPKWDDSRIKILDGKIVLIPVYKVEEGDTIYWDGCPSKVKLWYVRYDDDDQNKMITISPNIGSPRAQSPYLSEVKQLAVEYTVRGEIVFTPINITQWKKIVNEDAINKPINFIILENGNAQVLNDRALKFIRKYGSIKHRIDELREQENSIRHKIDEAVKTVFDDYGFEHTLGGWDCPPSPIGYCIYNHFEDPALDDCLFCHNPDERK